MTLPRPGKSSAPDVTVVVPAFNAGRYIAATLESVLAQQDVSLEVIVVDDCSTDTTAACVAEAAARDPRVRYLRTPSNSGGPARPRNLGVQAAQAAWVALCDADDLWHPSKLRLQLDVATRDRADLVCTAIRDFSDGAVPSMPPPPEQPVVQRLPYWQMLLKDRIATSSVMCRREALLHDGGFDPARDLVAVEDYDLWLRVMERPGFRVLRIDWPAVAYRRLPGSLSARKWRHAIKVMRVPRRASERQGWRWAYPLALPLIVTGYGLLSVYWRVLKGRL
jgi:glycosyltransferase involved in cell wall biosynthesis